MEKFTRYHRDTFGIRAVILFITMVGTWVNSYGQSNIYVEDFGASTTVALPYLYGTAATGSASKDSNIISIPSWSQSNASASFGGASGGCMSASVAAIGGTNVVSCTFNIQSGYQLAPANISYNYRISSTGAQKLDASIAGSTGATASISQVTTARSGAFVGATTSSFTSSTALTGTIILTITFSSTTGTNSTCRLDDVKINGAITPICTTTNTITPSSGPVGTEVTINSSPGSFSAGTAVTFNGTSATGITLVSSSQIKATVPVGAASGNLVTINSSGCIGANAFAVISGVSSGCETTLLAPYLFISEVTDSTYGGLTYVELYNATGSTIPDLSVYSLKLASNGGSAYTSMALNPVSLASGSTYVVSCGSDGLCGTPGGNGGLAQQVSVTLSGINFDVYQASPLKGNDHFALYKGALKVDSWGTYQNPSWAPASIGTEGADFRRKNTVGVPNTTYSNSDWNIIDYPGTGAGSCAGNDYSDIGLYNFIYTVAPTVTAQPAYSPSCKSTTLTVAGAEGHVGGAYALAYQWYVVAPGDVNWTALVDGGVYLGATMATLNISNLAGLNGNQYYCQIRENNATCYTASNAVKTDQVQSVWNGSSWTPSAPTISCTATINGNYDTTTNGSFEACSVTVNAGSTLTITPSQYVSIQNDLTITASGNLVVQNQGSLVMIDDTGVVTNSGSTQVLKTTSPYEKYDYTYWSSPVAGNTIGSTFSAWRTDYSFWFNTSNFADLNNDTFDDAAPYAWTNTGTATVMTLGLGYAIMAPTSGSFPATSNVVFSGAVNNGVVTTPISLSANAGDANDDYNLIGNPYPSALNATTFINNNISKISGTLYFWTHVGDISATNPGPNAQNFISNDYAMFNLTGGTRASNTGSAVPSGFISSGEGFLVEAVSAGNVTFNNSMRSKTYSNSQFFRNSNGPTTAGRNRFWLNLENQAGMFSQLLVGYFNEATAGVDRGYDGMVNQGGNKINFYSMIGDGKYKIQGRGLFDVRDQFPLGYSSAVDGTFTIGIDKKEGVFSGQGTTIYLEDRLLNLIYDLAQAPYVFSTKAGTFDNRFMLRYNNSLTERENFEAANNIVVSVDSSRIAIDSQSDAISKVTIYDVLGRVIYEAIGIEGKTFIIDKLAVHLQAMIVEIRMENNQVVKRKIIF